MLKSTQTRQYGIILINRQSSRVVPTSLHLLNSNPTFIVMCDLVVVADDDLIGCGVTGIGKDQGQSSKVVPTSLHSSPTF